MACKDRDCLVQHEVDASPSRESRAERGAFVAGLVYMLFFAPSILDHQR